MMARCRQNGRTVAAYYDEFNTIWSDLYDSISLPCCPCGESNCSWDADLVKQRNDDDKTRHFLIGLDHFYAALRSNLLAEHPFPSLNKVYELLVPAGKRHLTADLLPSILSRLPVKSLMRFRCVAKPWLALVDEDPDFPSLHFDVFNKNCDEIKLLVVQTNNGCSVRRSDTFQLISKIPFKSPEEWRTVSSVNGLVLLESTSSRNKDALKLWNPSIRQFRYIPPHPPTNIHLKNKVIGFGYDPLSKDYKIVKFVYVASGLMHSVLVCSLGTGLWKTIPFQVQGFPCPICDWNVAFKNSVYLHGSLHFIARDSRSNPPRYLLSFHLSNGVFSWISMPDVSIFCWPGDYIKENKLVLIDGGSSLAVYDSSHFGQQAIWVLEKETMSWKKRCTYALCNTQLLYGKKNGDMLTLRSHEETYSDKTGRQKSLWRNEVALYCPQKREYKILLEKRTSSRLDWIKHVFVFVESLKSC